VSSPLGHPSIGQHQGGGEGGVEWGGGVSNNAQKEDRIKVVLGGAEGVQEEALLKPLGSLDGSQGV
jgi:hypothetical protein